LVWSRLRQSRRWLATDNRRPVGRDSKGQRMPESIRCSSMEVDLARRRRRAGRSRLVRISLKLTRHEVTRKMRDDKEQVSSFEPAVSQGGWNGFDDRSATQQDCAASEETPAPHAKKPYRKPSYRHEKVFETMALSCGKIQPTQRNCFFNRHTS
jgi:hypothetical protein